MSTTVMVILGLVVAVIGIVVAIGVSRGRVERAEAAASQRLAKSAAARADDAAIQRLAKSDAPATASSPIEPSR